MIPGIVLRSRDGSKKAGLPDIAGDRGHGTQESNIAGQLPIHEPSV